MSNITETQTETAVVAGLAQQAAEADVIVYDETGPNVVALADGPGRVREVDLEKYGLNPRRATAFRIVYDAESFAGYLHRHETTSTEVFADVQTAKVVGVIDSHEAARLDLGDTGRDGRPGWQGHRITLQLTESPSWIAWTGNDGKLISQEEFAEFAEAQAADVREPSPADLLDLAQSLEMTKSVAFKSGQRLIDGQTKLVYEETAQAHAGEKGDLDIPKSLTLALKPYIGGPTYGVVARFRYRLQGQRLVLGFNLERPDLIREAAFADVVAALREGVQDDPEKEIRGYPAIEAPVYMGKP